MKKIFYLIPVAALAMTACTNETDEYVGSDQAREIAFTPIAQPASRAAGTDEYNAVEGTAFPQNYDMKVVAYSVPESGTAGNYFGNTDADGGIKFSYQFAGGASTPATNANYWGGNPAQYWPLAPATLNFLAVTKGGSPDDDDVVSPQFNANYASGVTVTLADNKPANANSSATQGQHDLMYAFGRASVTQTGNVLTIPTKVDMTFNHALAWVAFRIKAGNPAAEAISIKSIKLNGAKYDGTFTAAVTNYDKKDGAGDLAWTAANTKWTTAGSVQNDVASPNLVYDTDVDEDGTDDSKALVDGTYFNVGDGLLVVPTSELTSTTSMSSFTIEYYLNKNLYTYTYTPATDAEKTFAKGKKYVFDITMTLSEIFVNPSVEDWDVVSTDYVNIPTMAYSKNYTVAASKDEQTLIFNIEGLSSASNKYKVTVGGTDSSQVDSTVPTADTATALTSTSASVKVNMKANAGAAKTFTITIQERNSDDSADVGTATVITVTQAAGA